jgi:hypothetical protein
MFKPVRTMSRKCFVRAAIERLESRCLLSLAPAAGEGLPVTDWLQPIKFSGVEIVDSGSSKLLLPEIELGDLPEIPIPLPGDLPPNNWPPSGSPELPTWDPPEPPAGDWQEPSDPGGLIDIGDVESTDPDVFIDPASKREELAVIEMLAALSYRPGRKGTDSNLQSEVLAADDVNSAFPDGNAASGQPFQSADSEGGMMAIAADAVISKFVEDETPPDAETESLTDIPVRMDNAYGKFQVFEVSITEETSPARAAPLPPSDAGTEQVNAAEVIGLAESEPAACDGSPGRVDCPPRVVDRPAREDVSPAEEAVSPADWESAPSGAAGPRIDDEASSTSWNSGIALFTAAAVAFALRVHLTKREPGRDRRPASWSWLYLVPRH